MTPFKRIILAGTATLGSVALLAGCGTAPSATATKTASSYLPCVVGDVGGFNDHSFNELSLKGVTDAATKIGSSYKKVQAKTAADYAPSFANLVLQKCNIIVAAGFDFPATLSASAKANPKVDYVMIDDNSLKLPNVKDVVFQTSEAAFLGGYAAAAYAASVSKTPKVATWGGAKYPTVTTYMDGIADGVAYYNTQKKATVAVLGWDVKKQNGSFVGGFTNQNAAQQLTAGFLDQGANVIVPVAGSLYIGASKAITAAKSKAVLEGVDADLYLTDPTVKSLILTSILKKVDVAGYDAVVAAAGSKTFDNTTYIGTLKNGGVALAPFHDFTSTVPSTLADELKTIQSGIEDGSIAVDSPTKY